MTNEEKYRAIDERIKAFWRFCKGQEKKKGCLGCPTKCTPAYREQCALTWLTLESEEDKPIPCPFCGGEADVTLLGGHGFSVRCYECLAETDTYETREEAIAAWNRRVK